LIQPEASESIGATPTGKIDSEYLRFRVLE